MYVIYDGRNLTMVAWSDGYIELHNGDGTELSSTQQYPALRSVLSSYFMNGGFADLSVQEFIDKTLR